jgi:hypothetical protein
MIHKRLIKAIEICLKAGNCIFIRKADIDLIAQKYLVQQTIEKE